MCGACSGADVSRGEQAKASAELLPLLGELAGQGQETKARPGGKVDGLERKTRNVGFMLNCYPSKDVKELCT